MLDVCTRYSVLPLLCTGTILVCTPFNANLERCSSAAARLLYAPAWITVRPLGLFGSAVAVDLLLACCCALRSASRLAN